MQQGKETPCRRFPLWQEMDHTRHVMSDIPRSALGMTPFTLHALSIQSLTDTTFTLAVDWLTYPRRMGKQLNPCPLIVELDYLPDRN